ncbi:MAG: folate-binding protein [Burkholderiaceae bacterium]
MNPDLSLCGLARLTHLGVIRATGSEALKFLHGQLTNDMLGLAPACARLAGFCSAKGRLQASFIVWQVADEDVQLVCAADLLAATLKRLSMFVLRTRCKLSDVSAEVPLFGLAGPLAALGSDGVPAWQRDAHGGASRIALPDAAGVVRCLWAGALPAALTDTPALSLDTWRWLEVRSGIPLIEAATVDRFVPQMLNYELIGAVDFQKGCYPGQEVVARSQYRGTIKRRMGLFDLDAATAPAGAEIFHSDDPGQPAGMVVNAAPRPDGSGSSALVEVKLAALGHGHLQLGAGGPPLRALPMPYAVPLEPAPAESADR